MTAEPHPQLVIPMAGAGVRFSDAGYSTPKPLLPVHGVPMYQVVLANLLAPSAERVVFVARKEWNLSGSIRALRQSTGLDVQLVEVGETTGGPADSVRLALPLLVNDSPVVVANSDQFVDADLTDFIHLTSCGQFDGVILAMEDNDPKWSYVSVDGYGHAVEVREKQVISRFATVGIYGFRSVDILTDAFDKMQENGDRTNGEYYVAPSYNYMITGGQIVHVSNLGSIGSTMHGMGIPADYETFIKTEASLRAAGHARSKLGLLQEL